MKDINNYCEILQTNKGKQVKKELKLTLSDQIEKFKKQVDFINGIIKYLNN